MQSEIVMGAGVMCCYHTVFLLQLNSWMDGWKCTNDQRHDLLRQVYDAQIKSGKHGEAANTMISLLSAYTDDDASQAREDAHR